MDFSLNESGPDCQNTFIKCLSGEACTKVPLFCMKLIRVIRRIGYPGPYRALIFFPGIRSGRDPENGCIFITPGRSGVHLRAGPVAFIRSSAVSGTFCLIRHGHRQHRPVINRPIVPDLGKPVMRDQEKLPEILGLEEP